MRNLTKVIGPAPSEMSRSDLVALVRREHQRAAAGLEAYVTKSKAKRRVSSGPKQLSATKFLAMLKDVGMTLEEYKELQELKKEAESGKSTQN